MGNICSDIPDYQISSIKEKKGSKTRYVKFKLLFVNAVPRLALDIAFRRHTAPLVMSSSRMKIIKKNQAFLRRFAPPPLPLPP